MRVTTLLRQMLGVTDLFVRSFEFRGSELIVGVVPRWRRPRCGTCGRRSPRYDQRPERRWRHLGIGRLRISLSFAPCRVSCLHCKAIRVEKVPWACQGSRFTLEFEESVAYLAHGSDKTQVTKLMGITWRAVGQIVERVVGRKLDPSRLDGLRNIGVDEFSYRKRHRYITTVVDHDRRRVVWAAPRRTTATLVAFFDQLGEDRCAKIECVTMDMALGYIKAVEKRLPDAQIVFDRFHVQRLASDALDKVRRAQLREIRGTDEGTELFKSRFALLKNPWNLNRKEKQKLNELQQTNARI